MLIRVNGQLLGIREAIPKVKELLDADRLAVVKVEGVERIARQRIQNTLCSLYEQEGRYSYGIPYSPKPFRTQNSTPNSVEYTNAPK